MSSISGRRGAYALGTLAALLGAAALQARASEILVQRAHGVEVIPESSIARPQDAGLRAHTNTRIFLPNGVRAPVAGPYGFYENPMSLGCLYGVTKAVKGCNPQASLAVPAGGSRAIAVVDAFDFPTAAHDLAAYSKHYGLPAITASNFQVVYASGAQPAQDSSGGWELEEALDIEMAHALAPKATIFLVEAASNQNTDLNAAVQVAARLVAGAGGGEVTNSYGSHEYSSEASEESSFTGKNVVFFASAGDSAGPELPSMLQNVVAVGGTTVNRDSQGNYISQTAWSQTGGGTSFFVKIPSYQTSVSRIVGQFRGAPDISLVADPASGVWVYDTTPYNGNTLNWLVLGGTSVASPAAAALVNNAGHFFASSETELTRIYASKKNTADFTDITSGACGNPTSEGHATKGWDFCTGVGTPIGTAGK